MFKISKRIIISGAIGNALEMYDYAIWWLFSAFLSKEFLPLNFKLSGIFFLFLLTYILRPIGNFLGRMLTEQIGDFLHKFNFTPNLKKISCPTLSKHF